MNDDVDLRWKLHKSTRIKVYDTIDNDEYSRSHDLPFLNTFPALYHTDHT